MKSRLCSVSLLFLFLLMPAFVFGQFGRNKVQYERFEWKYIETSNFDIYFHQDGYYIAEFASHVMEEALKEFQTDLGYVVGKRIPLIIYNSHNEFQQTNVINNFLPEGVGGFTELAKNRIVLPFEGDWEKFRHVLRHELVHAFINDMYYGGSLQSYLRNNFQIEFPHWMSEGLAEYLGLEGYDTQTDMFMRDITISEILPPLERLGGYFSYRAGQAFWWYVAQTFGKAKVGELVNRLRSVGKLDQAFLSTFGMTVEAFSERWMTEMKRIYAPDISRYELPKEFSEPLTDHFKDGSFYNSSPAISPDGSKMAFISDRDMFFSVFVMDLESKKTTKVVSGMRSFDFEELNILTPGISWDPDGVNLAIAAKSGGEDALFIVNTRTGKQKRHTFDLKNISSVEWSPYGDKIVFFAVEGERPNLYLFEVATGKLTLLTEDIFSDNYPAWSPDGEFVYFISNRGANIQEQKLGSNFFMWRHNIAQSDIFRIDIRTKIIERLTFSPDNKKTSLRVAPDNKKLLYVSDKNGIGNIYTKSLETGEEEAITNSLTGITQISLSRDASKLLYSTQIKGGFDIYMLRYPLTQPPKTELPLTEYRQRIAKEEIEIAEAINKAREKEPLVGYGDFALDFSRQQVVTPNPDVRSARPGEPARPGGEQKSLLATQERPLAEDYKVAFSPDIIVGNPGFSTMWGALGQIQMLFSDVLGDHQIFVGLNLLLNLQNSDLLARYSYLPNRVDWNFSLYHTSRFSNFGNENFNPQGFFYRFRYLGTTIGASLPFSTFSRLEFNAQAVATFTENISVPGFNERTRFHIVPEMRYVHDNAVWGNSFGPVHGNRMFISAKASPKFGDVSNGFFTLHADYRKYFHFNDFLSLAVRGAGATSSGPDPQLYYVLGQENWILALIDQQNFPFTSAEDLLFSEGIAPIRGWGINARNGRNFFSTNVELRFPLFRAIMAGPIPVQMQHFGGVFFFDMAGLWNDDFQAVRTDRFGTRDTGDLLMSAGVGARAFLFGLPLKLDIAWRREYTGWSKPSYIVSFGFDF